MILALNFKVNKFFFFFFCILFYSPQKSNYFKDSASTTVSSYEIEDVEFIYDSFSDTTVDETSKSRMSETRNTET